MILFSHGMGAGVLLADLAALQADPKLKLVAFAPESDSMPDVDKLPDSTTAVIIADPTDFHDDPKAKAWIEAHQSDQTPELVGYAGHPVLSDPLPHRTLVNWILRSK